MTPLETKVLNILEKTGQARVRQVARALDHSLGYARHLLDYLTEEGHLHQLSRDTYRITPLGIDAVVCEYVHTLSALERRISKYLDEEHLLVKEIERLKQRKTELEKHHSQHV